MIFYLVIEVFKTGDIPTPSKAFCQEDNARQFYIDEVNRRWGQSFTDFSEAMNFIWLLPENSIDDIHFSKMETQDELETNHLQNLTDLYLGGAQ